MNEERVRNHQNNYNSKTMKNQNVSSSRNLQNSLATNVYDDNKVWKQEFNNKSIINSN